MKMKPVRKSVVGLTLLAPVAAFAKSDKPNIVFFLVDDMGWVDSSVAYGEEVYPNNLRFNTPNMARLAEAGVMLTNAYACPVSTPTRTSLMTGMNAAHTHITNWTARERDTPSDASGGDIEPGSVPEKETDILRRPDWNINGMSPVPDVEHTQYAKPFPQLLKDAGYFTIHVGKAHWAAAGTPGASPYNMGFVVNVAGNVAGKPRSYLSEDNYGNTKELWDMVAVQNMTEYYGTGVHLTEALTREALKTLEYPVQHDEPFFLYMAHHAVHTPIQPDKRFIQKYLDAGMDEGQARYASMIEGVDKSLGDLLDFLEKRDLVDNTIVIFMTDNGGNSENKQKGGILHTQNKPLREGKASVYEGGIRVPLIFRWPGHVAPGTRVNTPVIAEDLYPTILEMAGVRNAEIPQTLDGQSLVKLVTKGSQLAAKAAKKGEIASQAEATRLVTPIEVSGIDPERMLVFHYPHQWKPYSLIDIDYLTAVRKGEWKLVYRMLTGELELYNLSEDIGEQNNLAAKYPEKVKELATALSDQLRSWKASMPTVRRTERPVPMPDEMLN